MYTQETELDSWLFTIPGKTVPASDRVTVPLIKSFAFSHSMFELSNS